jgi:hypothetical protein
VRERVSAHSRPRLDFVIVDFFFSSSRVAAAAVVPVAVAVSSFG